jgi:4-aminobutyrate aminotransferase-like enzyme
MAGVELRRHDGTPATVETFAAIKALLQAGFVFLPEGEFGNVISFTPPLTITKPQLAKAVATLAKVLAKDQLS